MSQTALITLLSILLLTGGFLGGGPKNAPSHTDAPAVISTQNERPGVIRANKVSVHEVPRSDEVIATLVRGDSLTVLDETNGWYRVRLANGQVGYVNTFAVSTSHTSNTQARRGKYDVVAYYVTDSLRPSGPSLRENLDVITTLVPWMWEVLPSGYMNLSFDARDVGQALRVAGENGLKSLALVHNIRQTQSGEVNFDVSLSHAVLANAQSRQNAVEDIYRVLREWDMSGVHIDFEMVLPSDRQNLNLFIKALSERLRPAGLAVTIAVPSKTYNDISSTWAGGFDYGTIGQYVDQMMLMTYDEHWRGGPPGPVASIGWVERVVRYAISTGVPPEKIVLGIPAYGYDWPASGRGRSVTYRQAMELASAHGARIQWDDVAKVPYFKYGAGRTVYFEDRSSVSHKIELVKKYGLAGISLWRLGQEDPGIWSVIRNNLV